jgi:hypothetical protein
MVRRIGHACDLIVADPITEEVVMLEEHCGLEQLDQAVDQERERSRVWGELEPVAVSLEMREGDRREHQEEATGEHDFRRKVASDPDALLVEWNLGKDLVLIAGPVAEDDEDGKDSGGNSGETPWPGCERTRQGEAGKDHNDDGRSQRRIRDAGTDQPRSYVYERAIKRLQAVDDFVPNGMLAVVGSASEPVKRDVEAGEHREREEARNQRGKRCRRREKGFEARKHGEVPYGAVRLSGMYTDERGHGAVWSGTLALPDGNCKTDR